MEKEKIIRQIRSERDSLFEELKSGGSLSKIQKSKNKIESPKSHISK